MKKLKFSQANIITIAISLILSLLSSGLLFLINYIDPTSFSMHLSLTILLYFSWILFIYIISYTLIGLCLFNLPEKQAKEEIMSEYNLSNKEYLQVHYDSTTATKSLLPFLLIAHSEYYFYAKLNENEEIHLLVKNKTQDVIYNSTVSFQYFIKHFKKIK